MVKDEKSLLQKIDKFLINPSISFINAYQSLSTSEKTLLFLLFEIGSRVNIEKLKKHYEQKSII